MGEIIALIAAIATGVIGLIQYSMKGKYDSNIVDGKIVIAELTNKTIMLEKQINNLTEQLVESEQYAAAINTKLGVVEIQNIKLRREIDSLAVALSGLESRADVVGFMKVDTKGIIFEINAAITILFGLTSEDLIGKPMDIIIPPQFRSIHHDAFTLIVNSNRLPRKDPIFAVAVNKMGKPVYISLIISRWREGIVEWLSGEITEITKEYYLKQTANIKQPS